MGELAVEWNRGSGSSWPRIWCRRGQQQSRQTSGWSNARVALSTSARKVRFKGVKSSSYRGDMAIDTILISRSTAPSGSCPSPAPPPSPPVTCSFQSSTCGWTESGRNQWARGRSTPSSSTGATRGQDGSGRYFMYLETSFGRRGDTSYLISPTYSAGMRSINFWYHMHGRTMGELAVEQSIGRSWPRVWCRRGQQQSRQTSGWSNARVALSASSRRVRFKGVKGSSYTGDMAVDTISISRSTAPSGNCR
jgi:hypothetical protein